MKAVILAGGAGTRLRPYTTSFPKPLLPVGDLPILELLLRQLRAHEVTEASIMTGHLAYLIESYLGDGARLGLKIEYFREDEPLGTAGPLRQLAGTLREDFLVMNGDLLTDVDFTTLMQHHLSTAGLVTVSTYRRDEPIELGVLTLGDDGVITGYDEKPVLHFDVSMGLYAMSPLVLDRIPPGYYDMPHLISDLLHAGLRVSGLRHSGFWLDIGRVDDYARANEIFADDPRAFLPRRGSVPLSEGKPGS